MDRSATSPSTLTGGARGNGDAIFTTIVRSAAILILLGLGGMVVVMAWGARGAFATFGPGFVLGTAWNPVTQHFGAAAPVFGTLVTALLAIMLAVPLAFGIAVWLTEIAPARIAGTIGTLIQLLAAVPSIIFGMWGFAVLVPFMAHYVEPLASHTLGRVPGIGVMFRGAPYGTGFLTGGMILAVMVTPFISAVMRDVFLSMPAVLKESAYGLGMTRWEVVRRIILPWSRSSVVGGVMLGLGRALGETMAITFVIGNANHIGWSLFSPGNTIASLIALEFPESAVGSLKFSSLMAAGFLLMLISLGTLVCSRLLLRTGRVG
ncbi:phosphate ABC transporter permease subunit PstC [Komagataeibacter rhaeticus]|uniref:Phosphate transport system permease protein n=1 Tax=Komagataeibacter rhaeticus TaxID=215221 RepID=A0A181CC61_9PROT|nr:phosphate ABC transporter permease subunit PstC [Komagataeibacter rhaeticus]ATU72029.1 phosphate ABC transporter permease subunit PstC [Komagataeibacter xylinus]KDU95670.1 phosphate transporter permease subunit PstC [Komagataeibacter rhaeticus AF1]MBL7239450.1 phosphate ABC transporter permease subunit PstC [Komagataeibacter rhaeticus]PYD54549.1 phosphate ABC transporter permease subunit PstC [Komagataeibacter rhaeticus]QIP35847.1 phosphate ABC transporter permease subunit PstC [Komagataeib